jgi:bis(5'-nucleosyl)-tetraphosphatase (symmetrical)
MERVLERLIRRNALNATPRYTYAVGDVQGCFDDLLRLLDKIDFDPSRDRLWFTGDLVNKGPNSLNILRFVRGLGDSATTVLGNHDIYLLAAATGVIKDRKRDTLDSILAAHDCGDLLHWLRHQPLLHHDDELGYTMVHAGLPPQWDLGTAQARARELESELQSNDYREFLGEVHRQTPARGTDDPTGATRLRYSLDCFTQMRYCDRKGRLDLSGGRRNATKKKRSLPWFQVPERAHQGTRIIFGHWASLDRKKTRSIDVYPLDTGCSSGGKFTAMRLQDGRTFSTRCRMKSHPGLG